MNETVGAAVLLGIGLLAFGATFVPIILGFRQSRRNREFEHTERMKAFEMGRRWPGGALEQPAPSSSRGAIAIGAGVPIGVFGCAWLASMTVGYQETIWIAAAMVGMSGVICGTVLAKQSNGSEKSSAKPQVEEDAYDVVARRG
jgi:hypothetical protein